MGFEGEQVHEPRKTERIVRETESHTLRQENDKFQKKLVVFSYIRLTASDMQVRDICFASDIAFGS